MPLDIKWTLVVEIPQLEALTQTLMTIGDKVVASIDSVKAEVVRLNENQAAAADALVDSSQALTEQVTRIADEVAQWNASGTPVTDAQMTNLEAALKSAADTSAQQTSAITQQAAAIRANSDAIAGIIPDEPATP